MYAAGISGRWGNPGGSVRAASYPWAEGLKFFVFPSILLDIPFFTPPKPEGHFWCRLFNHRRGVKPLRRQKKITTFFHPHRPGSRYAGHREKKGETCQLLGNFSLGPGGMYPNPTARALTLASVQQKPLRESMRVEGKGSSAGQPPSTECLALASGEDFFMSSGVLFAKRRGGPILRPGAGAKNCSPNPKPEHGGAGR
ncbi:MAG: hypothetical protein CM15mP103_01890 [Gammaproteobacteria bacterium]|nr:MAG: hypothetical protein CM15mP103_01890 [Gammaproteobacteria bacterium]